MPIRTKPEVQSYLVCPPGVGGGSQCSSVFTTVQVPIRDWIISPSQLNKSWQMGTAAPGQLFQDFTFPELEWVYKYKSYKYKIKKVLSSGAIDFLTVSSAKLNGDSFNQNNLVTERVYFDFKNLDNLSVGTHIISVNIEAYGIDENNTEHYVESFYSEISIVVQAGTGISTDKNLYNLVYNKADDSISGDEKIIVFVSDPVSVTSTESFIEVQQDSVNSQRHLIFKKNSVLQNKSVGKYSSIIKMQIGSYIKSVTVNLEVINDTTLFYVSPQSFNLSLQKNLSETKTFSATINNPNNLTIAVDVKPSFIEIAEVVSGVLKITTKNSFSLNVGTYSGEILLRSGAVVKSVSITINVVQAISHDFKSSPYYFALDENKVKLNKTVPSAAYIKMTLKMYYKGFGEEYQEQQAYTFPYFKGTTEIYPGREIQDFFIKAKDINSSLNPVYQFDLTLVQMKFDEINDLDQVISTFELDNIYFAPGRKPKCFPFFTDYSSRSTYSDSIIKLCKDNLSDKKELKNIYDNYNLEKPVHTPDFKVEQLTFLRSEFKSVLKKEIISAGNVNFIPLPDVERIIHIEWENQNLVFDWFSASGDTSITPEIENVLGESRRYREEKFDSWSTEPLVVSTGWILNQEIDLVTDLLLSRLCFIYIDGIRYKAYPVGKKNEMQNSANTKFIMDLEFRILRDGR